MNDSMEERLEHLYQQRYFDPKQNLRERIDDQSSVLDLIFDVEEYSEKETLTRDEELFISSTLGYLYRLIGKPEESAHYHTEYLRHVEPNSEQQVLAFIRLGESYKYADECKKALICFEKAESIINAQGYHDYLDFLEQHRGKCYLELRDYDEAKASFEKALALRKQKNDQALVNTSVEALDFSERKIKEKDMA